MIIINSIDKFRSDSYIFGSDTSKKKQRLQLPGIYHHRFFPLIFVYIVDLYAIGVITYEWKELEFNLEVI
jgi:hypothetical protein